MAREDVGRVTFCHQGLNRHQQKRRHKRKLKQKYAMKWDYSNVKLFEEKMRDDASEDTLWNRKHPKRNGGFEYWNDYYLSGRRKFAKKCSDGRIRQRFRSMLANMDPDEIPAYKGADHEKEFDYNWTIW